MRRMKCKSIGKCVEASEMRHRRSTAISYLRTVVLAAQDVSSSFGIPGLSLGIGSLFLILDAVQKTSQNVEDIEELTRHLKTLTQTLSRVLEAGVVPPAVTDRINRFTSSLTQTSDTARGLSSRNIFKRNLTHHQDAQWVRSQILTLSRSIENFTIETILHLEFMLDEQFSFVKDSTNVTHSVVQATHTAVQKLAIKLETREGYLAHAPKAAFSSKDREACTDSTRASLLGNLFKWIDHDTGSRDAIPHDPFIFWINGSAGTGKTTIAYTVCKLCHAYDASRGVLGASFFCSRDDVKCSSLGLIVPAGGFQSVVWSPSLQCR
ncbi:hypothetical protein B0H14DRAFT_418477 [Mycena olivaceomarginata]|nr:hypothetical protein B0H14DRAFT_418477 [Mycena olivaceomarginata]